MGRLGANEKQVQHRQLDGIDQQLLTFIKSNPGCSIAKAIGSVEDGNITPTGLRYRIRHLMDDKLISIKYSPGRRSAALYLVEGGQ